MPIPCQMGQLFNSDSLTSQIYFPGISDQIPDGIFRPDLLAQKIAPDPNGRQQVAFNFIINN